MAKLSNVVVDYLRDAFDGVLTGKAAKRGTITLAYKAASSVYVERRLRYPAVDHVLWA